MQLCCGRLAAILLKGSLASVFTHTHTALIKFDITRSKRAFLTNLPTETLHTSQAQAIQANKAVAKGRVASTMSKGPKDIDQKKYRPSPLVFSSVRMPASTTNEDGDDIRRIAEKPPEERRCPTSPTSSRQEECPLQGQQGSSSLAPPLVTVKQNVINIVDQVLALIILEDEGKEVESDKNEDKGHEEQS